MSTTTSCKRWRPAPAVNRCPAPITRAVFMSSPRPALLPGGLVCAAIVIGTALAGCNSRPSAPALEDGPVFRAQREAFRFSVPDGWKQRSRGTVPSGDLEGERMLVEYKCMTCTKPASLEVTVAGGVPAGASLSEYVTKHTLTGEKWRLSGP